MFHSKSHRKNFWFVGLFAFAMLIGSGGLLRAAVPGTAPAAHTPFVTVLLRDWNRWDVNHDGVLSPAEIDRAVLDPMVTGDDAAVAGTLKLLSRSTKMTVPPLTRQYFLDYDRVAFGRLKKITPAAAEAATTDVTSTPGPTTAPAIVTGKKSAINWDTYFVAGQKRISRGGDVSWPDEIKLDDMRQGPLGDCFLVATIGSMVIHRPGEVETLIKPECSGGFVLCLPEVDPFRIRALTQGELVLSSTSSGEGVWLAALEQGFGKFRDKQTGRTDEEGTDIIAVGGQPGPTMAALTGHRYKRIHFATTAQRRDEEVEKMLPMVRAALVEALQKNRLITADITPPILSTTPAPSTRPTTLPVRVALNPPTTRPSTRPVLTAAMLPKIPPDINIKHAYAVAGYDVKTDMLEIWNPHGQTFKPKGPAGLQNGYPTEHGRFHVPLKEAYTFFTGFYFETGDPATMPTAAKSDGRR